MKPDYLTVFVLAALLIINYLNNMNNERFAN